MEVNNKKTLKWFGLVLFFCVFIQTALAQNRLITGKVVDEFGIPLHNISVTVKNTMRGVETDYNGMYRIEAKDGDVLIFYILGMEKQEHKVKPGIQTIDVEMVLEINELEDVVVVGYGSAKKVSTLVGSVVKIDRTQVSNKPSANLLDALQGKVAGLSIFSNSGEPYGMGSIRLHGIGSLYGGGDPLFILDGSPVSKKVVIMMNPSDFESVSVLKDASATSIYGTRAANGVIYITTRNGKNRQTPVISISSQYGFSSLASRKFFDDIMNVDEYAYYLVDKGYMTQEEVDALLRENPYSTRWDRVYFRNNVPNQQIDVSASGGGEKTNYYVSGSFFNQEGLMYRSGFKRYTGRINLRTSLTDWLDLNLSVSANYGEYMQNPYVGGMNASYGSLSILSPPIYTPVDGNGKRYDYIPGLEVPHPNYIADNHPAKTKNMNFIPQISFIVNPIENLTIKSQIGVEYINSIGYDFIYPSYIQRDNEISLSSSKQKAHTSRTSGENIIKTFTNTAEYVHNINGNNRFTFLLGQESVSYDNSHFLAISKGQTSDRATMLSHGTSDKDVGDGRSVSTYNSFFIRADYGHNNKYFFDISARRDGSSRFGKNNRYANFWSVGMLWKLKDEKFLKNSSWIDDLDLKFSVGTSGNSNALSDYASLSLVLNNQSYKDLPGYLLSGAGNPDIQWQKQLKTTLAVTLGMFKRADLTVEVYDRVINDMLGFVPRPSFSGSEGIVENGGKFQNRGIDATLAVSVVKGKDFYVTPFLSLNYNQEKILELHNNLPYIIGEQTPVSFVVGEPLLYFYPIFWRVNPEDGYSQWYLPGKDLIHTNIDANNVTNTFDAIALRQNTGIKRNPPFNGGFGLDAAYKNLSLRVAFAFSSGKYTINSDRYFTENPVGTISFPDSNQSRRVLDNWKKPGDVATFPAYEHGLPFTEYDSRLIEDASFIRMKDLTLSYSLPQKVLNQIGFFKDIRVFGTGRNLLTFTKYSGLDPEFDTSAGSAGANPGTKEYTFGIEIKF